MGGVGDGAGFFQQIIDEDAAQFRLDQMLSCGHSKYHNVI